MKILINRKPIEGPWGGGNLFVKAICRAAKKREHEIVFQFEEGLSTIFIQDPRYSDLGISINEIALYKQNNPGVKLIHRVNECDARKNTADVDDLLRTTSSVTDLTVFVSRWMKDYHLEKGWLCKNTAVIYNGVDKHHFQKREKIKNGKINIVAHHWSDNRMKGADVYEFLDSLAGKDERFTFTYIGRTSSNFKNAKVVSPLHGLALGKELSKYDVYVSGSRFDPGPNHILESLACEIPTLVHIEGGGAVEFAGQEFAFQDKNELTQLLLSAPKTSNEFIPSTWEFCAGQYLDLIESMIEN